MSDTIKVNDEFGCEIRVQEINGHYLAQRTHAITGQRQQVSHSDLDKLLVSIELGEANWI